jgi:hypothetical protein
MASAMVVALAGARPAFAAPEGGETDTAEELLKEGLALRRQGKDQEALEDFRRAFARDPSPRCKAQIALAEQALGRWREAEADLADALAAASDPWILRNLELLESSLSSIRTRLGWLDVSANAPNAELWVNDARVGTLPLPHPVRLETGSAVFEVRAAGYAPVRRVTAIEPGGSAHETVHLVALPPLGAANAGDGGRNDLGISSTAMLLPRPPNTAMRNVGYVVLGAGVAGVALGTYFGVLTLQDKSSRDPQCTGPFCTAQGVVYDEQARSSALRSTAWMTGGIVALLGGGGLLWFARARAASGTVGTLQLAPEVGPDRAGMNFRGAW